MCAAQDTLHYSVLKDRITRAADGSSSRRTSLSSRRSPCISLFLGCSKKSGDEGIRTPDPKLAKLVLSQLSYTPYRVDLGRVELPTSCLSGTRSNHLSYRSVVCQRPCSVMSGIPGTFWALPPAACCIRRTRPSNQKPACAGADDKIVGSRARRE